MKQYKYPSFYYQILFLATLLFAPALRAQSGQGQGVEQTAVAQNFTDLKIEMIAVTDSTITENNQFYNAVLPDSIFLYSIELVNLTKLDADSIVVSQVLSPDVTYISSSFPPSSVQENLLSWTLDELKGSETHSWDITVRVNSNIPENVDELVCFASFTCSNDSVVTNNSVTNVVKILRADHDVLDVGVEMTVNTDTTVIRSGQGYPATIEDASFQYAIRVFNAGPTQVENVQVIQRLDGNIISTSQEPAADNLFGRSLTWFFPTLGIGADTTILVEAVAAYNGETPSISTIQVSALNETANNNNADTSFVWVLNKIKSKDCDVELKYEVLADSVINIGDSEFKATRHDESFGYLLSVVNHGPATAYDIQVQKSLPEFVGANLFNLTPEDSTENGFIWIIDSLEVNDTWSVSILVIAGNEITDFPHRAVSFATVSAANDTLLENNTKEAVIYILGDPVVPADMSIKQTIDADSSETVNSEILPIVAQNEFYRITVEVANWSRTDAENVVLKYIVDDSLKILGTSPSADIETPDSVIWRSDTFPLNSSSIFIIDVQTAPVMPESRNILSNRASVSAQNEDASNTGNNQSILKMVNYGVPVQPFEPSLVVSPENPSVSDSIRIHVLFPVEIVNWDIWVYLPSGEIITDFADNFIRYTDIQPGEWYEIDVPFLHRTLMANANSDDLIFELHATGRYGTQAIVRQHVLVIPGFDLIPPNVVVPGSTEIPIDFVVPEGHVEMNLFDVSGRHIMDLVNDDYPSGRHTFLWNGQTENGQMVGSGVYLVTLHTEQANTFKKMIIVR